MSAQTAAIAARLAAATPGPWTVTNLAGRWLLIDDSDSAQVASVAREPAGLAAAELIANAPADLAWCLARIAELETELAVARVGDPDVCVGCGCDNDGQLLELTPGGPGICPDCLTNGH